MTNRIADEAEIMYIYVAAEKRRRGLAKNLLVAVLRELSSLGVARIFLEVRVDNRAAQALYASCGFENTGKRLRYYQDGCDALTMALVL